MRFDGSAISCVTSFRLLCCDVAIEIIDHDLGTAGKIGQSFLQFIVGDEPVLAGWGAGCHAGTAAEFRPKSVLQSAGSFRVSSRLCGVLL